MLLHLVSVSIQNRKIHMSHIEKTTMKAELSKLCCRFIHKACICMILKAFHLAVYLTKLLGQV